MHIFNSGIYIRIRVPCKGQNKFWNRSREEDGKVSFHFTCSLMRALSDTVGVHIFLTNL